MCGTIGIDRPFTEPIVSEVWMDLSHLHIVPDDRYRQSFPHSIVSDERYRYVDFSPFYCLSVGEQWRSKTARLSTINSSSPFIIHTPPAQRRIPEYGAVCPCCALRSLRWMVSTTRWCEAQACSLLERPVCVPFSYGIGYWANNRSAIRRIDTYRAAQ